MEWCLKQHEKKIELGKKHKETSEYLTICAILNPSTCLKHISEKYKRKVSDKISEEMQIEPKKVEDEDNQVDEYLTRDDFKASNSSNLLDRLYTRVWECSVN